MHTYRPTLEKVTKKEGGEVPYWMFSVVVVGSIVGNKIYLPWVCPSLMRARMSAST